MHQRTARVEEAASDGTFTMVLATEGEASDGDILSIKGGQVPERMPLLLSHWNDPTATAGSITNAKKELHQGTPVLRAVGHMELDGDGELADVRRDVWLMMQRQHVRDVSVRWDSVSGGKQPTRRVNLPSDHLAHVKDDDPDMRKRFGMFWHEWRALEGSIVAVGADPEAKAFRARAEETQGMVRTFWRAMAVDLENTGTADAACAIRELQIQAEVCREAGVSVADLLNAVAMPGTADDYDAVNLGGETFFLPQHVADQLRAAEPKAPDLEPLPEEPDLAVSDALSDLTARMEALEQRSSAPTEKPDPIVTISLREALRREKVAERAATQERLKKTLGRL